LPRSHPPTLITLVRAALREHALIDRGTTVLVAVSGGADSMALLHVLGLLRREVAFGLFAHGVDHGLRSEAAAELDIAEGFARSLEVPFERTRVEVAPGGNLQARARDARWDALRAAAVRAGASRIATGHHADDRAETMLMRILRGTGAAHLGVLPALDGDRIRPMLRARRADVEAHVRRHRIPHSLDPSNRNPRFLRTRVRLDLLPVLERLNPRVVEHMYALADELCGIEAAKQGAISGRDEPGGANRRDRIGIEPLRDGGDENESRPIKAAEGQNRAAPSKKSLEDRVLRRASAAPSRADGAGWAGGATEQDEARRRKP
jgi:tRNA(Ile)-lysidine synthase